MKEESRAAKFRREKAEKQARLKETIEKFKFREVGELKYQESLIKQFSEAIYEYPDLANLPIKLAVLGAKFRSEQFNTYGSQHMSALASARGIYAGKHFSDEKAIPEDLPALRLMRECIICEENKKCINLCPECWQRIREALEIKIRKDKGWDKWGYEANMLDLTEVIRLLIKNKPEKYQLKDKRLIAGEKGKNEN